MSNRETYKALVINVRDKLVAQGCQSFRVDEEGESSCAYRGDNDTKCGVGHLIKDEAYKPEIEGAACSMFGIQSQPLLKTVLEASGIPTDYKTMKLLDTVQNIHDSYGPEMWTLKFNTLIASIDAGNFD